MDMSKRLTSLACASALALTAPAAATVVMVNPSTIQGANVLYNNGVQTGTTVFGHTQGGTSVQFTGMTTTGPTLLASGGQSRVRAASGLLTQLNLSLQGGNTFQNLEFNLFNGPTGTATGVDFAVTDNLGTVFNFSNAIGHGQNRFGFIGTGGETIRSILISLTGGGIHSIRQVRLDEVMTAVPEPANWMMMVIGFGALGYSVRRAKTARAVFA
jgi:hypothetical protein